jgi:hypothetical protein
MAVDRRKGNFKEYVCSQVSSEGDDRGSLHSHCIVVDWSRCDALLVAVPPSLSNRDLVGFSTLRGYGSHIAATMVPTTVCL